MRAQGESNGRDKPIAWKPSMTTAEAEVYTKSTYYTGRVFYHGTDVSAARSISSHGVNPSIFNQFSTYGVGFYVVGEINMARQYAARKAQETGQVGVLLEIVLYVKNPKIYKTTRQFWTEQGAFIKQTGVTDDEVNTVFTNSLKAQGFDAVEIADLQFFIVFESRQVVVVRSQ